ncbi:hypothetical protein C1H46_040322 [Malus baccata]|uniref:Uncharacterized protein n=1 Tax=Malus baccata TaxID=106549 RepID=A0A540KIV2_MALBA|nr:hypothetical protein C1H46_040322 [Malus baccata]
MGRGRHMGEGGRGSGKDGRGRKTRKEMGEVPGDGLGQGGRGAATDSKPELGERKR